GEVSVVRLRSTELIVRAVGADPLGDILHPTAAAVVAEVDVKLLVLRAEEDFAAIVIAAQGLTLVSLVGAQLDDVLIECQRRPVPPETVDPVAEQRDFRGLAAILRPSSAFLGEGFGAAGPA